jgi:ATP-binding cassette subfamily C (CFTR/MRP) protein 4
MVTAHRVFVAMAMFNAMRLPMGLNFPLAVQSLAEVRIVLGRLRDFYALPETASKVDPTLAHEPGSPAVSLKSLTCMWSSTSTKLTLSNITAQFFPGQLVVRLTVWLLYIYINKNARC